MHSMASTHTRAQVNAYNLFEFTSAQSYLVLTVRKSEVSEQRRRNMQKKTKMDNCTGGVVKRD